MIGVMLVLKLGLTDAWPPRLALIALAAAGASTYTAAMLAIRARSLLQLGTFLLAGLRRGGSPEAGVLPHPPA